MTTGWLALALLVALALQHKARAASSSTSGRHRGVSWVAQPYEVSAEHVDALVEANVDWIVPTPFGWQTGVDGAEVELQADTYRAFFEVFWHRHWFAGAYFWKWYPRAPEPDNAAFTPQDKPAERVMSGWYGGA